MTLASLGLASGPPKGALLRRGDLSGRHAADDEFLLDGSGAPSGWTFVQDSTPRTTLERRFGWLHWHHTGTIPAQGSAEGIIKAVPASSPLTIETAVRLQPSARDFTMGTLAFFNSDGPTWASGDGYACGVFMGSQDRTITGRAITNWEVQGASQTLSANRIGEIIFLRMVWNSSNTFSFYVSLDGVVWQTVAASFAHTLTPAYMGLIWSPFSSDTPPSFGSFAYFRVYEEAKTAGID